MVDTKTPVSQSEHGGDPISFSSHNREPFISEEAVVGGGLLPGSVLYIDTGPLSVLAENEQWWPALRQHLLDHSLMIGISDVVCAEISEATRKHDAVARLLLTCPSAFLRPGTEIRNEEVKAYPNRLQQPIEMYLIQQLLLVEADPTSAIMSAFERFREAREAQKVTAEGFRKSVIERLDNFPRSSTGKYAVAQAEPFADVLTMQWLAKYHRQFFLSFRDDPMRLKSNLLASFWLYGLTLFYRYYLQARQPQASDFGDMFLLTPIPYCAVAVVERDLCSTLNQIKSKHGCLKNVEVKNVDFLRNLTR